MDPYQHQTLHQTVRGLPYIDLNLEPAIDEIEPAILIDEREALVSVDGIGPMIVDAIQRLLENSMAQFQMEQYGFIVSLGDDNYSTGSGLTEEKISALLQVGTIREKWDLNREAEEEDVCAICLGEYEPHDVMGILACRHRYHEKCIKHWLLKKNVCPMCKATALTVLI